MGLNTLDYIMIYEGPTIRMKIDLVNSKSKLARIINLLRELAERVKSFKPGPPSEKRKEPAPSHDPLLNSANQVAVISNIERRSKHVSAPSAF